MLCADAAFALMASATKWAGIRIPSSEVVFVRSAVSSAALLAFCAARGLSIKPKEPILLWSRGIIGYIAMQCFFWAIPQIALGTAVTLNYTAPIFAVLLSILLIGEKPSRVARFALVISFVGVWLLASPQFGGRPEALLAALISGLFAGGVYVMIRHSRHADGPLLVILYFTMTSTLGSGLWTAATGWIAPSAEEWAALAVITVSSFIGQLCLTYSLHKAPVWVVSPFAYLTPVLSLIIGWAVWKEIPSTQNLLGSAIVITCGIVMLAKRRTAL